MGFVRRPQAKYLPQAVPTNITVTVHKTTGDYSTIQSAIDDCSVYETNFGFTGWYKVEITDAAEYDEDILIPASEITSPSISHYIWLTTAGAATHDGTAGSGANILVNGAVDGLRIRADFTRVDNLEIKTTGRTAIELGDQSTQGAVTNVLLSRMIIWADTKTATESGIWVSDSASTAAIDNSLVYGFGLSGIIIDDRAVYKHNTTLDVDFCTVEGNSDGTDAGQGSAIYTQTNYGWDGSGISNATMNLYNTAGCGTTTQSDFACGDYSGSGGGPVRRGTTFYGDITWNGSSNLHTSNLTTLSGVNFNDNMVSWVDASAGGSTVTTTTANAAIFTNLTSGTEDYTPVVATGAGSNLLIQNGTTSRIGSEPDARQDFSTDISGTTRLTASPDIGAFQISVNTTVTVHKTLGDYSTVQSAVDDCSELIAAEGWYKVEIQDAASYAEAVTIAAAEITTPSATHYLWLTAASGVRHSGVYAASGCAQIAPTSGSGIVNSLDYTVIDWLQIAPSGGGTGITHASEVTETVTSHNVIRGTAANPIDGVVFAHHVTVSTTNYVDNNVIVCGQGTGQGNAIYVANNSFDNRGTYITHTAHNSLHGRTGGLIDRGTAGAAAGHEWYSYNDAAIGDTNTQIADIDKFGDRTSSSGMESWNGSNAAWTVGLNINGTNNLTGNAGQFCSGGTTVTTTTANAAIVTSLTPDAEDLTPVPATDGGSNLLLGTGTNRIGSEPDARQDFSLDVAGNTRPTTSVDIGAFNVNSIDTVSPSTFSANSRLTISGSGFGATEGTARVYVQKTVASDSFTRANETLTADANWSTQTGATSPELVSNHLEASGTSVSNTAQWVTDPTNDQYAEADVTISGSTNGYCGVAVRLQSGAFTCYVGVWDATGGGTYRIEEVTDGGYTSLNSSAGSQGTTGTKRLRLEAIGTSLKLYVDGVEEVSTTDASNTAGGIGPLVYYEGGTQPQVDNFAAGDITNISTAVDTWSATSVALDMALLSASEVTALNALLGTVQIVIVADDGTLTTSTNTTLVATRVMRSYTQSGVQASWTLGDANAPAGGGDEVRIALLFARDTGQTWDTEADWTELAENQFQNSTSTRICYSTAASPDFGVSGAVKESGGACIRINGLDPSGTIKASLSQDNSGLVRPLPSITDPGSDFYVIAGYANQTGKPATFDLAGEPEFVEIHDEDIGSVGSNAGDTAIAMWKVEGNTGDYDPQDVVVSGFGLVHVFTVTVPVTPNKTVSVHKTLGDYSTIQSAIDDCSVWDASPVSADGYYKIEVTDAATYTETLTIGSGEIATPTIDHYLWLTAASGVRHSGVSATTGHARLTASSAEVITVNLKHTRIEWLEIDQASTTGQRGVTINDADGCQISHCILYGSGSSTDDAISTQEYAGSYYFDNLVIHDWGGKGIDFRNFSTGTITQNHYVDHVSMTNLGADALNLFVAATKTSNLYVYNSVTDKTQMVDSDGTLGTNSVAGSHNASVSTSTDVNDGNIDTNTTSDWVYFGNGITTTDTTADAWIVTNTTATTVDLTPKVAGVGGANDILTAGISRVGSEPNARQDFSVDIAGNARINGPNVDIGAFQITEQAVNVTVTVAKTGSPDYSTIQSAVDDCSVLIDAGKWYKIEITDAVDYTEGVNINAAEITTPTIDHYLWLTTSGAARHDGTRNSGARIIPAGGSVAAINVLMNYTRVDWLEVFNNTTNASQAPVFIQGGVNNVLFSHCFITGDTTNNKDALELAGFNSPIYVDNCVISSGNGNANQGLFLRGDTGGGDTDVYVDHCFIYGEYAGIGSRSSTGNTLTWNLYNTAGISPGNSYGFCDMDGSYNRANSSATQVFTGTNNLAVTGTSIQGTNSLTSGQTSASWTATTTATNAVIVTSTTSNSEDFTPVLATGGGVNELLENGTNRIGSEPDVRQDFSVDITGATRGATNVDIGAYQISASAASGLPRLRRRSSSVQANLIR